MQVNNTQHTATGATDELNRFIFSCCSFKKILTELVLNGFWCVYVCIRVCLGNSNYRDMSVVKLFHSL